MSENKDSPNKNNKIPLNDKPGPGSYEAQTFLRTG